MHINKKLLFDRNLLAFLYKNWATKLQGWANFVSISVSCHGSHI